MEIGIIFFIYFIEIVKYNLGIKLIYKEEIQRKWGYVAGGAGLFAYMISPLQSNDMDYCCAPLSLTFNGFDCLSRN